MNKHQRSRLAASVLAVAAIIFSLFLWASLLSQFRGTYRADLLEIDRRDALETEVRLEDSSESSSSSESLSSPSEVPAEEEIPVSSSSFSSSQTSLPVEDSQDQVREKREGFLQWGLTNVYQISIPSLGIHAPVLLPVSRYWDLKKWDLLEQQMQEGLLFGVVAYPHSVPPGEKGSLILAGHSSPPNPQAAQSSFGSIFATLPDLQIHDRIILTYGSSSVTYEVTDSAVVSSTDTAILLQQDSESVLKLITCYPIGSVKDRLVVTAKKVDA